MRRTKADNIAQCNMHMHAFAILCIQLAPSKNNQEEPFAAYSNLLLQLELCVLMLSRSFMLVFVVNSHGAIMNWALAHG
jgi:hypothetical protein